MFDVVFEAYGSRLTEVTPFVLYTLVPSSPPPNVTAFNTSSTSIRVTWQGIPMGRIHGRLLGYSITYRGVGNHIELVKLVSTCFEHANLTRLSKYTRYEISVAGFTREGHGNRSNVSCTTDEDGECVLHKVFCVV